VIWKPHRRNFGGLSYFPVSTAWVFNGRFEPRAGAPPEIVNILGMEGRQRSPGAVVFRKMARRGGSIPCSNADDSELFHHVATNQRT